MVILTRGGIGINRKWPISATKTRDKGRQSGKEEVVANFGQSREGKYGTPCLHLHGCERLRDRHGWQ